MTATIPAEADKQTEAFAGRLFEATLGAGEILTIYLGTRLGLYDSLAGDGAATAAQLSARAGIAPRYAREWLEQQASAGILLVDDSAGDPESRVFSLPPGHVPVLCAPEHPAYVGPPMSLLVGGMAGVMPLLLDAYRSGDGVPYAAYGTDFRDAQSAFNRPGYTNDLVTWFETGLPDVHRRLSQAPPAWIADVACGTGWSAINFARWYPDVLVDGLDLDEASIADARRNLAGTDLGDRVRFEVRDAGDPRLAATYDLVTIFEALHDMSRPAEVLSAARALRADGGTVVVVDERTADTYTAPGDEMERFFYVASVLHCLPVGMAEQPSAGTGTVMRTETVRRYAAEAGFESVDVLDIEHPMFRFYRLNG